MADRAQLNTAAYASIPFYGGTVPKMGPKCVPLFPDFTAANSYNIDLTMMQQQLQIDSIQSVFIDNSGGNVPVTLAVGISKQIVVMPPFSQGVLPLFIPNPPQFIATSAGNTYQVQLICTNMPLPYMVWNARQSTSTYTGSGAISVSDAALEAAVVGNFYQAQQFAVCDNMSVVPVKLGNKASYVAATAAAATTIYGAVASQGWYFTTLDVSLSPDATVAAAGVQIVTLKDGATTLMQKKVYVPAAATNAPVQIFNLTGMTVNSKAANQALTITLGTALTAGEISVNIVGGLTTDVA